jgi:WhiB family redox-sensing transcriptional regulator
VRDGAERGDPDCRSPPGNATELILAQQHWIRRGATYGNGAAVPRRPDSVKDRTLKVTYVVATLPEHVTDPIDDQRRPSDQEWETRAACRGQPSEVFFGSDNETREDRSRREALAKRLCRGCPVLGQCQSYAVAAQEPYGIWGGMTPVERRRLLRPGCAIGLQPTAAGAPPP